MERALSALALAAADQLMLTCNAWWEDAMHDAMLPDMGIVSFHVYVRTHLCHVHTEHLWYALRTNDIAQDLPQVTGRMLLIP